ncbi:Protein of unknown function DUF4817 [Biomphalaria glabrata]|nr:Protein of unknown function DUF4817 [Biomphalaria glabrata]
MADVRLSFEEQKQIIKWYWKFENVAAVRRQWRREYGTEPLSRLTMTRLRDKFEFHGTVCDVHKGRSGRPRTATSDESTTAVLELFQHSPQKPSRPAARESDVSDSSVLRILRNEIQAVCAEISVDTLVRCTESVLTRTQQCIVAEGHQFGYFSHQSQLFFQLDIKLTMSRNLAL